MNIDKELVTKFLSLYLARCKYRHALAFLQFRKLLPKAKLHDLMELFNDRKGNLLSQLKEMESIKHKKTKTKNENICHEEEEDDYEEPV